MPKTAKGQGLKEGTEMAMNIIREYFEKNGNKPSTFSEFNSAVQKCGLSYTDAYNAHQNLRKYGQLERFGGTHNNNITYILRR